MQAISCCCMTRRPPGWRRPWSGQARGWCGAVTSAWTGRTTPRARPGISCGPIWHPRTASFSPGGSTCRRGSPEQAWIIPPSIDPFSAKNQHLDAATVQAILATIGVLDGEPPQAPGRFARRDGTTGEVTRAGLVTGDGRPGPADPVVVQVSRWDRLKDMSGVMRGFAEHVVPGGAGYLMLVGPMMSEVADDPEGALVLAECLAQWRALPAAARARVLLVTLPLDDVEENAAMVNAIQRHAQVVVQKSLAEGFGLTVAEGMWKGRPVVGSAVGGILDQIADGTGVLLPDPADLAAFGSAVRQLLDSPDDARLMGKAGKEHIRENYVGDRHLARWAQLIDAIMGD